VPKGSQGRESAEFSSEINRGKGISAIQSEIGVNRYSRSVERCEMSDIPEEALNTIEESFGSRFVPHAPGEAEPHAEQPF